MFNPLLLTGWQKIVFWLGVIIIVAGLLFLLLFFNQQQTDRALKQAYLVELYQKSLFYYQKYNAWPSFGQWSELTRALGLTTKIIPSQEFLYCPQEKNLVVAYVRDSSLLAQGEQYCLSSFGPSLKIKLDCLTAANTKTALVCLAGGN